MDTLIEIAHMIQEAIDALVKSLIETLEESYKELTEDERRK